MRRAATSGRRARDRSSRAPGVIGGGWVGRPCSASHTCWASLAVRNGRLGAWPTRPGGRRMLDQRLVDAAAVPGAEEVQGGLPPEHLVKSPWGGRDDRRPAGRRRRRPAAAVARRDPTGRTRSAATGCEGCAEAGIGQRGKGGAAGLRRQAVHGLERQHEVATAACQRTRSSNRRGWALRSRARWRRAMCAPRAGASRRLRRRAAPDRPPARPPPGPSPGVRRRHPPRTWSPPMPVRSVPPCGQVQQGKVQERVGRVHHAVLPQGSRGHGTEHVRLVLDLEPLPVGAADGPDHGASGHRPRGTQGPP